MTELTLKEVYDTGKVPCLGIIVYGSHSDGPWGVIEDNTKVKFLGRGRQLRAMAVQKGGGQYYSIPYSFPIPFVYSGNAFKEGTHRSLQLDELMREYGPMCDISFRLPTSATWSTIGSSPPRDMPSGPLTVKAFYQEELLFAKFKDGEVVALPVHLPIKVQYKRKCKTIPDITLAKSANMFYSVIKIYPTYEVDGCKFRYNYLQPSAYLCLSMGHTSAHRTAPPIPPSNTSSPLSSPTSPSSPLGASPLPPLPPSRLAGATDPAPPIPLRTWRDTVTMAKRKLPAPPPQRQLPSVPTHKRDSSDDEYAYEDVPDIFEKLDPNVDCREPGDGSDRRSELNETSAAGPSFIHDLQGVVSKMPIPSSSLSQPRNDSSFSPTKFHTHSSHGSSSSPTKLPTHQSPGSLSTTTKLHTQSPRDDSSSLDATHNFTPKPSHDSSSSLAKSPTQPLHDSFSTPTKLHTQSPCDDSSSLDATAEPTQSENHRSIAWCLRHLELTEYRGIFRDHNVDYDLLTTLDLDMLVEDIGMEESHAHKLFSFVNE